MKRKKKRKKIQLKQKFNYYLLINFHQSSSNSSSPPSYSSSYCYCQDFLPSALPSRNNPRIPKPIRTAHFDGETANSTEMSRHASFMDGFSSDILDDSHLGTIKSLVIDSKPKTPLDLIQVLLSSFFIFSFYLLFHLL